MNSYTRKYICAGCLAISVFILCACSVKTADVRAVAQPMAIIDGLQKATPTATPAPVAVTLINSQGTKIGTAQLTQMADGVQIHLAVSNLPPGMHGIHIHNAGLCKLPDFKSAGAHFNPFNKQHGFKNLLGFHAGDLPNLIIHSNGSLDALLMDKEVTLKPGKPNSLLSVHGTSLIIHQDADDYRTDPSGNSGSRIACGVIASPTAPSTTSPK